MRFLATPFADTAHSDAVKVAEDGCQTRPQHVVKIGHVGETMLAVKLSEQPDHSGRTAVLVLHVGSDHREIGRSFEQQTCCGSLGQKHKAHVGI